MTIRVLERGPVPIWVGEGADRLPGQDQTVFAGQDPASHHGVATDTSMWTDDRRAVAELGIGVTTRSSGIVAMLRPEKEPRTFLRAALVG